MKERPILFSGSMVRAILDGRKTQTRRVVKPQPLEHYWKFNPSYFCTVQHAVFAKVQHFRLVHKIDQNPNLDHSSWLKCPYGQPTDQLWVRETWAFHGACVCYRADGWSGPPDVGYKVDPPLKWRPSIFMPRWASRITLEITGIRVERLQEIDEIDAQHEGVLVDNLSDLKQLQFPHRQAYKCLWDEINGKKYPWKSNPWVWVVEFKPAPQ